MLASWAAVAAHVPPCRRPFRLQREGSVKTAAFQRANAGRNETFGRRFRPGKSQSCPAALGAYPICEKPQTLIGLETGAGTGNRTLVFYLEGSCSAIELHPRLLRQSGITVNQSAAACAPYHIPGRWEGLGAVPLGQASNLSNNFWRPCKPLTSASR